MCFHAPAPARHPQAALPAGAVATAARAATATCHVLDSQHVAAPLLAQSPARLPQPSCSHIHAHTRYTQPAAPASRAGAAADADCSPAASLPGPRPPPNPATASTHHAPTYINTSDHTPVGGEPAPILAREVGTGQAPCAVANRRSGLEPGEPQLSPVSQVRRHCVVSAVARGQVGGRRSAAREGARERTGLESASHRCFDRQADTYPTNECAPERAQPPYAYSGGFLPDGIARPSPRPLGGGALHARPSPRPPVGGVLHETRPVSLGKG